MWIKIIGTTSHQSTQINWPIQSFTLNYIQNYTDVLKSYTDQPKLLRKRLLTLPNIYIYTTRKRPTYKQNHTELLKSYTDQHKVWNKIIETPLHQYTQIKWPIHTFTDTPNYRHKHTHTHTCHTVTYTQIKTYALTKYCPENLHGSLGAKNKTFGKDELWPLRSTLTSKVKMKFVDHKRYLHETFLAIYFIYLLKFFNKWPLTSEVTFSSWAQRSKWNL